MGTIGAVFGSHDSNTLTQLNDVASRADRVALMADGHLGYVMPIGGVAAYKNKVSVVGVGFDIACGNAAIRTDVTLQKLTGKSVLDLTHNPHAVASDRTLRALADEIASTISFGIGRKNNADDAPVDHPLFLDPAWWAVPNIGSYRDDLLDKARRQLGTVGSGNHYVDVFVDNLDRIWVGVHFGSRGLGHTIATNFNAIAQGGRWGDKAKENEVLLDLDTPTGQEYWALMNLAGQYAYAGREWVARKVVELLGGKEFELVHNHHNFAWKENLGYHHDEEFVVVRKGATPAFPGQKGFVGGSMGDDSVILKGVEKADDATRELAFLAMYSTVHGAGRVMSRTEAAGKRDRKTGQLKRHKVTGEIINAGRITPAMQSEWLARKGVILRGGGLDEAPQAYRRLPAVLEAQQGTIEVTDVLHPLVVCMAGANELDPYKD
jgi:tRNA-splicing ligase RtcB